jgi:Xaa-Pro aminopeptidase
MRIIRRRNCHLSLLFALSLWVSIGPGLIQSEERIPATDADASSITAASGSSVESDDSPVPAHAAPFSVEELASRRGKVYEGIGDDIAVMCGFYASANEYRRTRQHNNFYYLTGVELPNCALLLDGRTKQATLFVPVGRPGPTRPPAAEQITAQTGIENVIGANQFADTIKAAAAGRKRVFMLASPDEGYSQSRDSFFGVEREPSALPGDPWILRAKQFRDSVKNLVGELEVANLQTVIDPLRRVKSTAEIARMREAGRIGAEGIADTIRGTRPGILERELEGVFELACLRNGAHGTAWTSIVATGPKITEFHYFENSRRIQPGEMILIDAGPDYNYYCSDLTRVWPASGPYSPRYRELYDKLLEVHKAMVAAVKPGVTYNDVNKVLRDSAKAQGIDRFIVGGAGHYTGMAPHDVGSLRDPFVPGVVFNIEPLLVIGPENLHIRFEDTVLCTETGHEVFTPLDVLPWEADKLLEMRDKR